MMIRVRREQWKQREEERKLFEEALVCHQNMIKERAEAEGRKWSLGACIMETCIICK